MSQIETLIPGLITYHKILSVVHGFQELFQHISFHYDFQCVCTLLEKPPAPHPVLSAWKSSLKGWAPGENNKVT